MSDEKKIDEPQEQEDVRLTAMMNTIGTLKVEALAQTADAVDPAKVAALVRKNTKSTIDATGNVNLVPVDERGERLRMPNGEYMTVGQYVSVLKASPDTGYLFTDGAASKPKEGEKTPSGFDVEVNPWSAEHWNLTQQGMYLRREPELAARLQAAAGGNAATGNPFLAGPSHNLTRQAEILRENPALGEQLRQEAKPEDNPWVTGNITKQVIIMRSDPARAARLKAEAKAINGPDKQKSYIFTPPPGSFKRMGTGR
jgi:hypothetical protein